MWYKLTFIEQCLFLLVILWPVIVWISIYLAECTIDGFWIWMYDNAPDKVLIEGKTYNVGNTNNTGNFLTHQSGNKTTPAKKVLRGGGLTGLVAGERLKPPRAHFFGRMSGMHVQLDGEYDISVLNQFELAHWKRVCARKENKEAKEPAIATKIKKITGLTDIDAQNRRTAVDLGIIPGNTSKLAQKRLDFSILPIKTSKNPHFPDLDDTPVVDLDAVENLDLATAVDEAVAHERAKAGIDTSGVAGHDGTTFQEEEVLDLTDAFAQAMGGEPIE